MDDDGMTPRQKRIFEQVFLPLDRPVWPQDTALRLRERLEEELAGVASAVEDVQWIGKSPADRVLRCEGLHVAQRDRPFEWTVPLARGKVAHRTLSILLANPTAGSPLDITERVLESYRSDAESTLAKFIAELSGVDAADLLTTANNAVVQFMSDWPARIRGMKPRFEHPLRSEICDGKIRLVGTPDLLLGTPVAVPGGSRGQVVIADFKTGDHSSSHLDDLRWYALVQTLRDLVPPFRVVSYYLESGDVIVEQVTPDTLEAAARRAAAVIHAIVELRTREPALSPGHHCRWCPVRDTCVEGGVFLSAVAAQERR